MLSSKQSDVINSANSRGDRVLSINSVERRMSTDMMKAVCAASSEKIGDEIVGQCFQDTDVNSPLEEAKLLDPFAFGVRLIKFRFEFLFPSLVLFSDGLRAFAFKQLLKPACMFQGLSKALPRRRSSRSSRSTHAIEVRNSKALAPRRRGRSSRPSHAKEVWNAYLRCRSASEDVLAWHLAQKLAWVCSAYPQSVHENI